MSLTPAGRELIDDSRISALEQAMLASLADGEVELLRSMPARCRTALA